MIGRLLLGYAVVELVVTVGLAAAIGVGWTAVALTATFVLGLVLWAPMGGVQLSRQFRQLRTGTQEPRRALTDGALTTLATALVVVPGLASTALGLLLLTPPIRAAARPALASIAGRLFDRRTPLITTVTRSCDYIDGEVIDVIDAEPPALPVAYRRTARHP